MSSDSQQVALALVVVPLIVLGVSGIITNSFVIRFYWTTRSKFVSRIFIIRSFLHSLISLTALFNAASFLSTYQKTGGVMILNQTAEPQPDNFMFAHHMALVLLQRLTVFVSMTLSFMRTVTILVPFRKLASGRVYAACSVYGIVVIILQLFGASANAESRQPLATNVFVLAADNISFFSIFYVMPFITGGLVILASIVIATWKLNLKKSRYRNQERETRVRREMTATIRLVGLIFLICNTGYPVFLSCVFTSSNLRQALLNHPELSIAAYLLGNVMSFLDAAVTPVILTVRGSQLKRVHRENLQRALKRISSRRDLAGTDEPDRLTLQFLAASSMQLSSLGQEVINGTLQKGANRYCTILDLGARLQGPNKNMGHNAENIVLPGISEDSLSSRNNFTVV